MLLCDAPCAAHPRGHAAAGGPAAGDPAASAAVDDAAGPKFLTGHGQRLDGHFVELGIGLLLNLDEVLPTHVVVLGPLGLSCLDWYGGIWNQSNRYQGKIKVK